VIVANTKENVSFREEEKSDNERKPLFFFVIMAYVSSTHTMWSSIYILPYFMPHCSLLKASFNMRIFSFLFLRNKK